MKYYYKEKEITSKEQWKKAFCESYNRKGVDRHWREGRSGECLAEDFIGEVPNGEDSMIKMVKRFLNTDSITLDVAKIEYKSDFDNYKNQRIQDLAIWGQASGKRIFIGVEAKVDESFGTKSISQQRSYVNGLTNTKADKRLNELVQNFLDGDEDKHGQLRYQLLFYLAGSFCVKDVDIIFMPVVVYRTRAKKFDEYSESKGTNNKNAYEQFMKELGFEQMEHVIGGQILMAYYKKVSAHGLTKDVYSCYIVK